MTASGNHAAYDLTCRSYCSAAVQGQAVVMQCRIHHMIDYLSTAQVRVKTNYTSAAQKACSTCREGHVEADVAASHEI